MKNIFNLFGTKEKSEKSLLDYQEKWKELVDKAFSNYSSLSREERTWFNIQSLISSVDDGGLISHYYNSGADHNLETIEDLDLLGFSNVSKLLKTINKYFPNAEPSNNIDERNIVIENWNDEYDKKFSEYDKIFFENEDNLEKTLIKFIEEKIINS